MKTRMNPVRIACAAVSLLGFLVFCEQDVLAQDSAKQIAKTASPELVGQLTKALSISPAQASGGAGALFGLAKSRLSPSDFSKVAASVPGIEGLIKSAPASPAVKGVPGLSSLGSLGDLASTAGAFQKMGLSPEMVSKFVPVLTKYVESKGGPAVASLLAGVLK